MPRREAPSVRLEYLRDVAIVTPLHLTRLAEGWTEEWEALRFDLNELASLGGCERFVINCSLVFQWWPSSLAHIVPIDRDLRSRGCFVVWVIPEEIRVGPRKFVDDFERPFLARDEHEAIETVILLSKTVSRLSTDSI